MNVKALCDTKEYRFWSKKFIKPSSLNNLGDLVVPNLFYDVGVVNTAFDILLRLILYSKSPIFIWHNSLRTALANYKNVFKKSIKSDLGFEHTEELDVQNLISTDRDFLFEICVRLSICENFTRSLALPQDINQVLQDLDVAKLELDWLFSEYQSPDFGEFSLSPALRYGGIYGEPDIVTKDCIWDIKCSSVDSLKRDTFNQQVTYLLLAQFNGSKVESIGFSFPRFNKNLVFNLKEILGSDLDKMKAEFDEVITQIPRSFF